MVVRANTRNMMQRIHSDGFLKAANLSPPSTWSARLPAASAMTSADGFLNSTISTTKAATQ